MTEGAGPERAPGGADDLFGAAVLAVEGRELTGRDLLAAGIVSGRWPRLERELREGLGLVAAQPPPAAEVRQEVQALRLARRLLAAEDMRAWLRARRLTMSAVTAAAGRIVARRSGGTPAPIESSDVWEALAPEAVCSGAMSELGWWMADRILSAAARELTVEPVSLEDQRIQRLVFEEVGTVAGAGIVEPGLERGRRLAWISALDDAHRAWEESVTGDRDMAQLLREHELDWCRLELVELRVDFPGAAAEAMRQLMEGGSPQDVATAAGGSLIRSQVVLADAPAALTRMLAGAVAGDVLGPWNEGEQHVVVAVRARTPPDLGDRDTHMRARDELVADAAARLRAGKVEWFERA